ncbi:MAG: hypothetical protein OXE05_03020 [Chloroflexi bacterium]|nr:hypothetical protein [Chloroflexota bacterium]
MINADPHKPDRIPLMETLPSDVPDALDADTVLTVVSVRTVMAAGFAAGALLPCIPLVLLGAVGVVATLLFNRGTIGFTAVTTFASSVTPLAVFTLLLVVLAGGVLGAVMGAVRRWSVRRGISWSLLVGSYFSSHPGPQSVIALAVVPILAAATLHAVGVAAGYRLSFAPIFFIVFPPAWLLSGLMFESAWEALVLPMLRSNAAEPMRWLMREAALFRLLKDDSYLFECRLDAVRIDAETGVAHVQGDFRTPDHLRRVRDIGLRVIGVKEVEASALPTRYTENAQTSR